MSSYCPSCQTHEECRAAGCSDINPRNLTWLDDFRPHRADMVVCVTCGHSWVAVYPNGSEGFFECSVCGEMSGDIVQLENNRWVHKFLAASKNFEDTVRRTMMLLNIQKGLE